MPYSDSLVDISDDAITLRRYYFPFGSRRIPFSEIERINSDDPTLLNGRWRIWGTGTFRTWFPLDWERPLRDRIFFVTLANRWGRIGFTVEDSKRVARILKQGGLQVL